MEGAANPGFAVDADFTAHQFHQLLGDGQTQSGAAVFTRGGSVRLRERLEQLALLFPGHADTSIANRELD